MYRGVEIFVFEQGKDDPSLCELYYVGKNSGTFAKFEGGKQFRGLVANHDSFCEIMEEALNFLEGEGYEIFNIVRNPLPSGLRRYEIFARDYKL